MITGVKDLDIKILVELSYEKLSESSLFELCKSPILWRNKIKRDFPLRSKIYYTGYLNLYKDNPKKLYEIIRQPAKIVKLKNLYIEDNILKLDDLKYLEKGIVPHLSDLPLLRGDIIRLDWADNRATEEEFIWDGDKFLNMDYETNVWGCIPKEFSFPEFPIDHFNDFSSLIWISDFEIREIINNFDEKTQKSYYKNYNFVTGIVTNENGKMELVRLNKGQFTKYVIEFPFIDNSFRSEYRFDLLPPDTLLIPRYYWRDDCNFLFI